MCGMVCTIALDTVSKHKNQLGVVESLHKLHICQQHQELKHNRECDFQGLASSLVVVAYVGHLGRMFGHMAAHVGAHMVGHMAAHTDPHMAAHMVVYMAAHMVDVHTVHKAFHKDMHCACFHYAYILHLLGAFLIGGLIFSPYVKEIISYTSIVGYFNKL